MVIKTTLRRTHFRGGRSKQRIYPIELAALTMKIGLFNMGSNIAGDEFKSDRPALPGNTLTGNAISPVDITTQGWPKCRS